MIIEDYNIGKKILQTLVHKYLFDFPKKIALFPLTNICSLCIIKHVGNECSEYVFDFYLLKEDFSYAKAQFCTYCDLLSAGILYHLRRCYRSQHIL